MSPDATPDSAYSPGYVHFLLAHFLELGDREILAREWQLLRCGIPRDPEQKTLPWCTCRSERWRVVRPPAALGTAHGLSAAPLPPETTVEELDLRAAYGRLTVAWRARSEMAWLMTGRSEESLEEARLCSACFSRGHKRCFHGPFERYHQQRVWAEQGEALARLGMGLPLRTTGTVLWDRDLWHTVARLLGWQPQERQESSPSGGPEEAGRCAA